MPLASTRAAPNAPAAYGRASSTRTQRPQTQAARAANRVPVPVPQEYLVDEDADLEIVDEVDMDVEEAVQTQAIDIEDDDDVCVVDERDIDSMEPETVEEQAPRVWPEVSTARAHRYQREVDHVRHTYKDPVDEYDMTMVSEYAEDIFDYMNELEVGRDCGVA